MRKLFFFCGHYGSGKTNIAVNYALHLRAKGLSVAIADLDTVNPYFRTKDSEAELAEAGVRVISLPFANTNLDIPSIPSEVYSIFANKDENAVFDIGGDDSGAYVLGRFAPLVQEENCFENWFVVNFHRPLTPTPEDAEAVMREIEGASQIPFTGIINNSNLGEETTAEDVLSTVGKAEALSARTGLPVVMTTVAGGLEGELGIDRVFALKLQKKYW